MVSNAKLRSVRNKLLEQVILKEKLEKDIEKKVENKKEKKQNGK